MMFDQAKDDHNIPQYNMTARPIIDGKSMQFQGIFLEFMRCEALIQRSSWYLILFEANIWLRWLCAVTRLHAFAMSESVF